MSNLLDSVVQQSKLVHELYEDKDKYAVHARLGADVVLVADLVCCVW